MCPAHGMALWCVVGASVALMSCAVAAVEVTTVATAASFREAAASGAEHILITEHIDLRDEEDLHDESSYRFKVEIMPRTVSITGNCEMRPDLPLEYWETGQCVMTFGAMSGIRQNRAAGPLWLHNIYVFMARPEINRAHRWAVYLDTGRPLYLTSVSIDGNSTSLATKSSGRTTYYEQALRIGSDSEGASGQSTGAVADRLQVINYHAGQASPVEIYDDTRLVDNLYWANWVYSHHGPAPGAIYLKNARAALAMERCRFHSNTGYDRLGAIDVAATSNSTEIYSDTPLTYYTYSQGDAVPQQSLPLEDAATRDFLSLDDEQFVTLQRQVQEAVSLLTPTAKSTKASLPEPTAAVVGVVAGVATAVLCATVGLLLWRRRVKSSWHGHDLLRSLPSRKQAAVAPCEMTASTLASQALTSQTLTSQALTSQALESQTLESQTADPSDPTEYLTVINMDPNPTYNGAPLGKGLVPHAKSGALHVTSRPLKNDVITMTLWSGDTVSTSRRPALDSTVTHIGGPLSTYAGSSAAHRPPAIEELEDALDGMHAQRQLLADRWELLNAAHRRVGGQGVVQFIKDAETGEGLVVKFFLDYIAFEREVVLYNNPKVRKMMAAIVDINDNSNGDTVAPNGLRMPPFIVLEQGRSLNEWALINEPDYITSFQVLLQIVKRLQLLHAHQLVHRDVKPANLLWRTNVGAWTLIDFGCTTVNRSDAVVAASVSYAPPEVALALKEKRSVITVDTSMDIWSLGVVIYELLVGERAFPGHTRSEIIDALNSPEPLPWEEGSSRADSMKKLGIVRRVVAACLSRNPESRPSAESLLMTMDSLFCSVTTVKDVTQS